MLTWKLFCCRAVSLGKFILQTPVEAEDLNIFNVELDRSLSRERILGAGWNFCRGYNQIS